MAWVGPLFVLAIALFSFYPALSNGFVAWDDPDNLINNTAYQGLTWPHLKWMFTSFHMAVYIPLTWVSFALDYSVWGLNPQGYHLTNLVIHGANAVLVYYIALRFFQPSAAATHPEPGMRTRWAAAVSGIFFAIHPLRVESVAWVTERRDVLSGFFFLWTIWLYLTGARRASFVTYLLSLLSKATGVTLPALLLVIDAYHFRKKNPTAPWSQAPWKQTLLEKLPYAALALPITALALYGQWQNGTMAPLGFDLGMRLAVMSHSIFFYLAKTLWPTHLSPLYPLPLFAALQHWPYPGYFVLFLLVTWGLFYRERRWPAALAAWAWYVLALFPTSGFFQSGGQLTADRYSYLPSLSGALCVGGGVLWGLHHARRGWQKILVQALPVLWMIGASAATRDQTLIWRDSLSFWTYAAELYPESVSAHNNRGAALAEHGRVPEAIEEFHAALRIDPEHPGARHNLSKASGLLKKRP